MGVGELGIRLMAEAEGSKCEGCNTVIGVYGRQWDGALIEYYEPHFAETERLQHPTVFGIALCIGLGHRK